MCSPLSATLFHPLCIPFRDLRDAVHVYVWCVCYCANNCLLVVCPERRIRGPTWRRSARVIRDRTISVIVDVSLSEAAVMSQRSGVGKVVVGVT